MEKENAKVIAKIFMLTYISLVSAIRFKFQLKFNSLDLMKCGDRSTLHIDIEFNQRHRQVTGVREGAWYCIYYIVLPGPRITVDLSQTAVRELSP